MSIRRLRGLPVPPRASQIPALVLAAVACFLVVAVGGCGGGGGTEAGGTVVVYVAVPLCVEAQRELAGRGGRVGDVRVRAVCLADAEAGNRLDLAALGANARRTTEDSSSVAYIGEPTRNATSFSSQILGEAGIAQISNLSGSEAMAAVLKALQSAGDTDQLRKAVDESLGS